MSKVRLSKSSIQSPNPLLSYLRQSELRCLMHWRNIQVSPALSLLKRDLLLILWEIKWFHSSKLKLRKLLEANSIESNILKVLKKSTFFMKNEISFQIKTKKLNEMKKMKSTFFEINSWINLCLLVNDHENKMQIRAKSIIAYFQDWWVTHILKEKS